MAKQKHPSLIKPPKLTNPSEIFHLDNIRKNATLWYRVQVLLHDLANVGKDTASQMRLASTTNELYISEPYFTDSEANCVRMARVDLHLRNENDNEALELASDPTPQTPNVEQIIQQRLCNFFEKRKASGDARPCGPHDMLPIYLDVFGMSKEELKDERFLSRLRRSGQGLRSKVEEGGSQSRPKSSAASKKGRA